MKLLHQGNQKLRLSYGQDFDYPAHLHNALEVVLLTRGKLTALCDSIRVTLEKGDLFIAFPSQVHGYENSQNTEGFVLIVPMMPYLEGFRGVLGHKKPAFPVLRKNQWQDTSLDTLLQMALFDKDHPDRKVMQGYIMTLTGKILSLYPLRERSKGDSDGLRELLTYINDHFREPLSRGDIARAVGYNESYVSHLFADTLHTTLTDYITTLRLDEAKSLLRDTDRTVSDIAGSLGFGSIRSFNRTFLRHTGMTPTQYRRS
nr:helix-turn-helix domain-containing protein [Oscillospiraceae bacterium]